MADRAIRVLPFTGRRQDWRMWEAKYSARARAKGWQDILTGKVAVPASTASLTDAGDIARRQGNDDAYADLVLSMEDETAFNIVNEARTTELPDGSAKKAWDDLFSKYAPSTKDELVATKKEFNMCVMEKDEDPENYLRRLEAINRKIKTIDANKAVSDEDVLIHAVANLSPIYTIMLYPTWKRKLVQPLIPLH